MKNFILLVSIISFFSVTPIVFGQIDITNVVKDFTDLTAGQGGRFTVYITNTGNNIGTFQVKIDCGVADEFTQTQLITLGSKQSATVGFTVSAGQTSEISDSCTFTATDTTSFQSDTYTTSFTIVPRPECEQDGYLTTVFEDGVWKLYECANGKLHGRLVLQCGTGQELEATGKSPWQKCVDTNSGEFNSLYVIIPVVIGGIGLIGLIGYRMGKKSTKHR